MSSVSLKTGRSSKLSQGPAGAQSSQNLLLDKVNARTSTPDSEALASSEDELDHRSDVPQASVVQPQKPVRRSSWLNDTTQTLSRPRKGSFASSSMSPTASHPSTPSAEAGNGPWGSHSTSSVMGRATGTSAFTWGTGIWNDRKDAPSRLSEVLPSPTSTTSPVSREPGPNPQIPFAIPLHPTPKTYRSQSYSVGQLDPEIAPPPSMCSSAALGRARHPALQHRPSRPSMLSEMANDGSVLSKVKEVEGDDESPTESLQGSFHQMSDSKTIEMLTRENAMLRQQQQYNSRIRPRASTGATYLANGYPLRETVPEESDYAIDELDESNEAGDPFGRRSSARRMSEYGGGPIRGPGMDNRKVDNMNLKKALWSSSPGFFGGDVSQSRRHSFANMPTRQGSISSIADSVSFLDANAADGQPSQGFSVFPDGQGFSASSGNPAGLFGNGSNTLQAAFNGPYGSSFGLQDQFANRAPSPHRNIYGMAQPRHNQLLHVVLFKCARADVFYIQEGTGLTVKPGDLVIVEADRGTDLGTVAKDNVDWQTAKELKEHYAEEHYKWLMMYSQGAAAAQEGASPDLLTSTGGFHGSAVGGMGPPSQNHIQEPSTGDLRPKLIKRLAQNHEVHSLRDKEGQEAKAKRVCMQKVKEHGLNMEILDAEFQMDWKKLTFYYFADSYINFNSLVTDLFKIYKTRIWMSAINPASFASPTLGIQAPSGVGPGANHQAQEQQSQAYVQGPQGTRGFRAPFAQPFGGDRPVATASGYSASNYAYGTGGGAFANPRGYHQNDWTANFQGLSLNTH
ncbi:PSP1 domain-containing protein [Hirsutella rhossiliensis]|uniref:PSP1 domain-containing protein n=1 Tax=Hirsutella rhossiliensis TaxID=111463 RepID=A0A9P8SKZ9_9HYPO|nr:PSP1 domain-containing protein [Hirsutella rhossiliensis]KAH0966948.1 PSP1 domain-containing protein [Hirsutella rhossiliensis]